MVNDADKKVAELLKTHNIGVNPIHVSFMDHVEWKHDLWSVIITSGGSSEVFEYKTGTGHRQEIPRDKNFFTHKQKQELIEVRSLYDNVPCHHKQSQHSRFRAITPTQASILYCLLSDAEFADYGFRDFCDSLGCSSDSLTSLRTFDACLETGQKLNGVIPANVQTQLKELLEDY